MYDGFGQNFKKITGNIGDELKATQFCMYTTATCLWTQNWKAAEWNEPSN